MTADKTTPRCLSRYRVKPASKAGEEGNDFPPDTVWFVGCGCGSDILFLEAIQTKVQRGVCSKTEFISFRPPVYTLCPSCKHSALLFDPVTDGWAGEMGLVSDIDDLQRLSRCSLKPGVVTVRCHYSENLLQEIQARGVTDPENYYTELTVYLQQKAGQERVAVVATSCA